MRSSSVPDAHEIQHRQVLHVFAQADAAGVRADRHAELRRQQQNRQHFVDAADPATVDLTDSNRVRLQKLLEHHPVGDISPVATLIGETAFATLAWPRMSSGLTGSSITTGWNSRERPIHWMA